MRISSAQARDLLIAGKARLPGSGKDRPPVRIARSARVIEALARARVRVEYEPGRRLLIVFDGGRLLSLNDLFAMHHLERHDYKKQVQAIVEGVIKEHVGVAFKRVAVRPPCVLRQWRDVPHEGECLDEDAVSASFKAMTDALRYCGMVIDDKRRVIPRIEPSQSIGRYRVAIEIESIEGAGES